MASRRRPLEESIAQAPVPLPPPTYRRTYGEGRFQVTFMDLRDDSWYSLIVKASNEGEAIRRAYERRPLVQTFEWIVMPLDGPAIPTYQAGNVSILSEDYIKYRERSARDTGRPTRRQRAFIAYKIPILMDEGYPQQQAIAIAHSMAGVPRRTSARAGDRRRRR